VHPETEPARLLGAIIAPVSIILGPMNLKPTGVSWVAMP
jgi:hypothetical protein